MNTKLENVYNGVLDIRGQYKKKIIIAEIICIFLLICSYSLFSSLCDYILVFIFIPIFVFILIRNCMYRTEGNYVLDNILFLLISYIPKDVSAKDVDKVKRNLKTSKLLEQFKYGYLTIDKTGELESENAIVMQITLNNIYPEQTKFSQHKKNACGIYFRGECKKSFEGYTIITKQARINEEEIKFDSADFYQNYIVYGNNSFDTNNLVDNKLRKALMKVDIENLTITFEDGHWHIFDYKFFDYFSHEKIDMDTLEEIMNHFNQMLYLVSILNND